MKREHENMKLSTHIAWFLFMQAKMTRGLVKKQSWEKWIFKHTNSNPLYELYEQGFSIFHVLVHILVFTFHLTAIVHHEASRFACIVLNQQCLVRKLMCCNRRNRKRGAWHSLQDLYCLSSPPCCYSLEIIPLSASPITMAQPYLRNAVIGSILLRVTPSLGRVTPWISIKMEIWAEATPVIAIIAYMVIICRI